MRWSGMFRFAIAAGERVGLVGESGSGKSLTARAIMRLIPQPGRVTNGARELRRAELATSAPTKWRGTNIAMITQDPLSSLNPLVKIGTQITEMLRYHRRLSRAEAQGKAEELLRSVGIPDPRRTMTRYPAVLSGGMRQRVALAIAISCEPRLLIADEPTTALDVTVQAQVLTLLERMTAEHGSAVLLISHDLGVVGNFCDRLLVMYAGRIVESGPTASVSATRAPLHAGAHSSIPSLRGDLPDRLASIPGSPPTPAARAEGARSRPAARWRGRCAPRPIRPCEISDLERTRPTLIRPPVTPATKIRPHDDRSRARSQHGRTDGGRAALVDVRDLRVHFKCTAASRRPLVKAVDGVTFELSGGETLGLAGESGSGKSTVARTLVHINRPTDGSVLWPGRDRRQRAVLRAYRRRMQMVYQDPYDSLDPV